MAFKISQCVFVLIATFDLYSYFVIAESGFFWHVTDFHYDPTYWTTQLSCNDDVPNPGLFGDYWCDSNWRLVNDSIANMALIKPDVDFVIWTGDSVAHIKDANNSLAENLEILKNITDVFKEHFQSNVKFLPSLGNHDFYPSDQADVKEDEMYNETAKMWKEWIKNSSEVNQFMKGGFYSTLLNNKIRLLALNTNLYFDHNKITKNMPDPAGQFAWMENILANARTNGEKVIVTAHVTPGILTPNFVTWMHPEHHKKYVNVLTKFSDVILASHYGHDHSDGFKIIQDQKDNKKSLAQFVAPSVTPWRFRAGSLTGKPHNPGIRLVEYDKDTGKHINYVQYYINLTDTNNNNQSNWKKLYDFKQVYGVPDMSVKSLRAIFDKMEEDGGVDLAQEYCNNAVVSAGEKICTDKNRFEIICGGLHYDLGMAKKCVDKGLIGSASFSSVHFSCLFASFVLMIKNVFYS